MNRWTKILEDVIPPSGRNERPFVCDGFPDTCEVIIIGANPATLLNHDWRTFWDDAIGFKYDCFMEVYEAAGGNPNNGTRARLQRIRSNGLKCVETNVYSTEGSCGTGEGIPNDAVLKVLLRNMPRLKGIIAHGKVAHKFLDNFQDPLPKHICRTPHFFNQSYKTIDRICEKFKQINPATIN